MSSPAGKFRATQDRHFQYGMEAAFGSVQAGRAIGKELLHSGSECFDKLFDLSSVSWVGRPPARSYGFDE